jgi:hypothetical protein
MPPGAEPLTGEWKRAKNGKNYFTPLQPEAIQYGRASKAGEHLKGGGDGLANWKAAMAALGTVMSDSVRSQIVTLINEYKGDPYYAGDDGGTQSGKERLMESVENACKIAGSETASARGTEFHHLAELTNRGEKPTLVQPYLAVPLAHYRERVQRIKFHAQEITIVNDDIKRAGSIDYLLELPAGITTPDGVTHDKPLVCCSDLKTGKWDVEYPAGVAAQLAAYGLGMRYDQVTNTRSPLHPDLNTQWGVLVHYPLATPDAGVNFYFVSLQDGLEAARLNNRLGDMMRYFRSVKGKPVQFEIPREDS